VAPDRTRRVDPTDPAYLREQLQQLEDQLVVRQAELGTLRADERAAQDRRRVAGQGLNDTQEAIARTKKLLGKSKPNGEITFGTSEHALLQYLTRFEGVDVVGARERLLGLVESRTRERVLNASDSVYHYGPEGEEGTSYQFFVRDGKIVSIIEEE